MQLEVMILIVLQADILSQASFGAQGVFGSFWRVVSFVTMVEVRVLLNTPQCIYC